MELIDKQAFIADIDTEIINLRLDGLKGTPRPCDELKGFIDRIENQPTVQVVFCAECTKSGCCIIEERLATARAKDRYCGLGERREGE